MSSTENSSVGSSSNLLSSKEINEGELTRVLKLKNAQSASLIMMLLCDGILDLRQMEVESDNEMFESRLKAVRNITCHASRRDIVMAARNFGDTFFTKGDAISFLHPKLYYACACALFRMKPYFLLENCSLCFLYERVQSQPLHSSALNDDHQTIYVSKKQFHIIARRLAEAIKAGNYSMSLSHPMLKEDFMVEKVFQELTKRRRRADNKMCTFIDRTDRGTYLLQWAIRADNLTLVKKIVSVGHVFSKREIIKGFYTCSSCGNVQVLQYLFVEHESVIEPADLKIAFHSAIDNCYIQIVYVLMRHGTLISDLSSERQQKLFHMSAEQEDSELCETILSHVLRNCPISHTVSMAFREKQTKRFRNICSELLHISCKAGHLLLAEFVIPFSDINNRDEYGRTPLINAAFKGRLEVFCLLVSRGADLTLIDNFGDSALHLACWGGNQSIVRNLLPSFDINSCGRHAWTPLMQAAICGNKEAFDLFVTKGADFTLTDIDGNNVFHLACQGGNVSVVECLLPSFDINIRGRCSRTPIAVAAINGKKEVFDLLLSKKADLTLTDNNGDTVYHLACQGGNASIVECLIPAFDINVRGLYGQTPVMIAALKGKKEVFDLLSSNGADLTLIDNHEDTIFHNACEGGNASIVECLLPSFDINVGGSSGQTPIMMAASHGKKEVFDLLSANGADITLTDENGDSVYHLACLNGNVSIVECLLPAFDIDVRGMYGQTPIMIAANSGKKEVFDLLESKYADLTLTDNDGDTVFHLACRGGNAAIVKCLLKSFDINIRGMYLRTPIMMAAYNKKKEVFDMLLANKADLTITDIDGDTVFHLACAGGNVEIVKHTMSLFNIDMRGEFGLTPLMKAVGEGHIEVFDLLLENANVTLKDDCGDSLLHLACEEGNVDMVKHVMPYSDVNLRNNLGWTPAMVALVFGQFNVFQYLVVEGADLTLVDSVGDDVLTLAYYGGCSEVIKELSPAGEDIKVITKWTELMRFLVYGFFTMHTVQQGSPELIQRDGFGDTLLHLACRGGNIRCVEHLLPCYDINVRGRYGWSPVMMAARCGHVELVRYLVSHQADKSLVSDTGEDVLSLAQRATRSDIVTLLTSNEFTNRD